MHKKQQVPQTSYFQKSQKQQVKPILNLSEKKYTYDQDQQLPLQVVYFRNSAASNSSMSRKSPLTAYSKSKIQGYSKGDGSIISFYIFQFLNQKNEPKINSCKPLNQSSSNQCKSFISAILYFSPNGAKHKINVNDVKHSQQLAIKLFRIIQILNTYNDQYYQLDQKLTKAINSSIKNKNKNQIQIENTLKSRHQVDQVVLKKYKITEYTWQKAIVQALNQNKRRQQTIQSSYKQPRSCRYQHGYIIKSNDLNASVSLMSDFYRVKIQYLQICSGKFFANQLKQKSKNQVNQKRQTDENGENDQQLQDNILSKYAFHPPKIHQQKKKIFNFNSTNNQICYKYKKVVKFFTIFNLPQRWYEPIRQIWSYILINKLVKHQFLYIDFEQNQIPVNKSTKIIKPSKIVDSLQQSKFDAITTNMITNDNSIPVFSKPVSAQPFCKWIYQQNCVQNMQRQKCLPSMAWLNQESDMNILYDSYGYWLKSQNESILTYKKSNSSFKPIQTYHSSSIPLTTKIQFEVQRKIKPNLSAFVNYIDHNLKKSMLKEDVLLKNKKQSQNGSILDIISNDEPYQEQIQNIGVFKAYPGEIVITKFIDRIIMNLNGKKQIIDVVDAMGEKCQINLNSLSQNTSHYENRNLEKNQHNPYIRYRQHLHYIKQFYQRVYYASLWQQKKKVQENVRNLLNNNKVFLDIAEYSR